MLPLAKMPECRLFQPAIGSRSVSICELNMPERTMLPKIDQPSPESSNLDSAEVNMRRALGLFEGGVKEPSGQARGGAQHQPETRRSTPSPASGARPRQRFVQDGDVPVTVVNRNRPYQQDTASGQPASRAVAAEAALDHERTGRVRAERSLQEALATVRELHTKLAHAEMARQEAAGSAESYQRAAAVERDSLNEALAAERSAREAAEHALAAVALERDNRDAELRSALARLERPAKVKTTASEAESVKKARGSAPKSGVREPQPVKWWITKSA